VSPRQPSRVQPCGEDEARRRLRDARAQLDLAELAGGASSGEERKAAVSCAVLAGIASADAACCTGQRLIAAVRQARALVAFAEAVLAR
jgi:hypothetical protein